MYLIWWCDYQCPLRPQTPHWQWGMWIELWKGLLWTRGDECGRWCWGRKLLERFTAAIPVKKTNYILVPTSMLPANLTHPGKNLLRSCTMTLVKWQQPRKQKLSFNKKVGGTCMWWDHCLSVLSIATLRWLFLQMLLFDISVDWPKNAIFCTR